MAEGEGGVEIVKDITREIFQVEETQREFKIKTAH